MKKAVSISLGSSDRDKHLIINLMGEEISVERIGTNGDPEQARRLFAELDGKVDAFGMGGLDLYLRLGDQEYPIHAARRFIRDVKQTPVVDGRGLKHTLEQRVFELAAPLLDTPFRCKRAIIPVAADRVGLAKAVSEVAEEVIIGDLIFALGIPIPIKGIPSFTRLARLIFPFVSYFPLKMLFYGSGKEREYPRYHRFFKDVDCIAGDFLFMKKFVPGDLSGKTIITNTTTEENLEFLFARGVRQVITTTPRIQGRSFGTNMIEAVLTALAGKGRALTTGELNTLIDECQLRPSVIYR
jgi:hypothetical protein